jgi:UDP-N-acetylglucosamine 2-epimerase (non-hydrolysing)
MKIMTIIGTRPEVIKLSRVIYEIDQHMQHVLVHSGQNYDFELNEIFFQQLGIRKPDHFLNAAGSTVAQTIGNVIARADEVMEAENPDALLLLGDTNSCLSAIAAKRRKIPIFHMEAGNRCFDLRVPEEINRKIVDHISDINLTYTVLAHYLPQILASTALSDLNLEPKQYFIVSAHREENVDNETNFANLLNTLQVIVARYGLPIIVSTHPRTRMRLEGQGALIMNDHIHFLTPLGFLEYNKLQMNARCVISDSGTITEESSILNFPAVTIRQAHERPEGMDEGTLIMCGLEAQQTVAAIEVVTTHQQGQKRIFRLVPDYDTDIVSKKVLRIIMSYTDYINRVIWHKL